MLTSSDTSPARGKASADTDIVEARFVDVVPNVRVVQAVDFVAADPAFAGISAEDHAAGLEASLANLAAYLED